MDRPADAACARAYIGIGANLGDARTNVMAAIAALDALPHTRVVEHSCLFRTAPIDGDGDDYVNAVACIETSLQPEPLLQALLQIEHEQGRLRTYRNAPRPLDLDILLYAQRTLQSPTLTIPHPRLTERAFVLIPLLQIAPLITIPGLGPAHAFAPSVAGQPISRIVD
ncbi:MAG: 2-amino-4-hydroxy-6-hydroxymethyldihydropteridine diphosphokinase [Herminiimonas sp.]|nr:2-amino-4-hydroxy-6-hydroxymethyldihydropteridine diphosphokinase [Herminiimonas sp.]